MKNVMGNSRRIALNHRQATVLSEPLKLPSVLVYFPTERALQVEGTFLSQLLPRGKVLSWLLPALFSLLLSYPRMWEIFLAMLSVWDKLILCLVGILWELFLMLLHFQFIVEESFMSYSIILICFSQWNFIRLLCIQIISVYQILAKIIKNYFVCNTVTLFQRNSYKKRFLLSVWK